MLSELTVRDQARYVMVPCAFGYATHIPLDDLTHDLVIFAWQHNGVDWTPDHGYSLRLVVPHVYGWKSAKWLQSLKFISKDKARYWKNRVYHIYGDPWRDQRHSWN